MTTSHASPVSRRAALAGLGAASAALALEAHSVAASNPADSMSTHPIVGVWYGDFEAPNAGALSDYTIFHGDGTLNLLHPFAGPGIGSWEATGERTGNTILKYLNIAEEPGAVVPGTVTVWESFTVDDDGEGFTTESVVELRAVDGAVVALFPYAGSGARRLTVEPPPPLEAPDAATPTA